MNGLERKDKHTHTIPDAFSNNMQSAKTAAALSYIKALASVRFMLRAVHTKMLYFTKIYRQMAQLMHNNHKMKTKKKQNYNIRCWMCYVLCHTHKCSMLAVPSWRYDHFVEQKTYSYWLQTDKSLGKIWVIYRACVCVKYITYIIVCAKTVGSDWTSVSTMSNHLFGNSHARTVYVRCIQYTRLCDDVLYELLVAYIQPGQLLNGTNVCWRCWCVCWY